MEEDQRDAPWSKETVIRMLYVVLYALIYAAVSYTHLTLPTNREL